MSLPSTAPGDTLPCRTELICKFAQEVDRDMQILEDEMSKIHAAEKAEAAMVARVTRASSKKCSLSASVTKK